MDGIAILVKKTYSSNEYGQPVPTNPTEREIFVTERSVTRSEFFSAGRQGLNPDLMLVTPKVNYDGEEVIIYNGEKYAIYRTYQNGDDIELYLTKKAGANGR